MEDKKRYELVANHVLASGQIRWKNGGFFLWDVPMVILPIYNFVDLYKQFTQAYQDAEAIFYRVGEKQAILAIDYRRQMFGVKDTIATFKGVLEQSLFLGYGPWYLMRFNEEELHATVVNQESVFAQNYSIINGKQTTCVDYYFAGTIAGMVEALTGKKVICIETKCVARGDNECVLETFPPERAREKDAQWCKNINPIDVDMLRSSMHVEKKIIKSRK